MRGAGLVALAAFLWGMWPLFLRHSGMPGYASGFVAMAVTSLVAVPVLALRVASRRAPTRAALLALVGVGAFDAGNVALYFGALAKGPVSVAVLTHYLAPLLVGFGAPLLLKERVSRRALVAAPVMLAALAAVVSGGETEVPWATAAFGAGSAVFYAANVLCSKLAAQSFSPFEVVALHGPVAALTLLAVFQGAALPSHFDLGFGSVVIGSVVSAIGATVFFNIGLRLVPAPVAGVVTYLEPVTVVAVGMLFFGEELRLMRVVGAAVVVAMGAWVALEGTGKPVDSGAR